MELQMRDRGRDRALEYNESKKVEEGNEAKCNRLNCRFS